MLLSTAIAGVSAQFDTSSSATSDAEIRSWIHAVVQDAVARSKWLKAMRRQAIVAGADSIALADDVVDAMRLRVIGADGSKSRPWLRIGTEKMWELEGGGAVYTGPSGTGSFAPDYTVTASGAPGVESVKVSPVPTADGGFWELHCAVLPAAILSDTSPATSLPLPEDLARQIAVDGAIGYGMRVAFQRHDDAGLFEQRMEAAVQELTRRANGRIGDGPIRIGQITRPRG